MNRKQKEWSWKEKPNRMTFARKNHASCQHGNKVFVFIGITEFFTKKDQGAMKKHTMQRNDIDVFDIATGQWKLLSGQKTIAIDSVAKGSTGTFYIGLSNRVLRFRQSPKVNLTAIQHSSKVLILSNNGKFDIFHLEEERVDTDIKMNGKPRRVEMPMKIQLDKGQREGILGLEFEGKDLVFWTLTTSSMDFNHLRKTVGQVIAKLVVFSLVL